MEQNDLAVRIDPAGRGRYVYVVVNRWSSMVVAGPFASMREAFDWISQRTS